MDDRMVYLCGTSILPETGIDRPVVFLVDSAATDSIRARLEDTKYEIMPNIWSDKKILNNTSDYLGKVYKDLSEKAGLALSQIHRVDYPSSFWEIPMASWLLHYIQALYDRYARLKAAVNLYGVDKTTLLACRYDMRPSSSYAEFIDKTSRDERSASFFYGILARELGIPVLEFDSPKPDKRRSPVFERKPDILCGTFYRKVYKKLKGEVSNPIPLTIFRGKNILMAPYGFTKREMLIFSAKSDASFFPRNKPKTSKRRVDRTALLSIKGFDEFEDMAVKLLPALMPPYLLEEFDSYHEHAKRWADYKAYFSITDWYSNILFCYAASLGRLRQAKIIGCQHGGGYGQYERTEFEFVERKFCDFYITWGWRDSLYDGAHLMPLAQPTLSRNLNKYRQRRKIALWCGTTMPKQLVRFGSYIPDVLGQYLATKKKFIDHLADEVRSCLIYRPHPVDYGWSNEELDILKGHPEVRIEKDEPLSEVLKEARLYICDHQSTSFMEAFAINTPTILFWCDELVSERENAASAFELLRKEGILFHDPVAAANQVNRIWDDVKGWWHEPSRQEARRKFIDKFCKADHDWQKQWVETFKKII